MSRRVLPIHPREYRDFFSRLWNGPAQRLGLAVSGGVDSMALAYLTRTLVDGELYSNGDRPALKVHAFIIDHGARPESTAEAAAVAGILKSYGFAAEILPLLWKPRELSKAGFETRARAARYRTLANACVRNQIFRLLLAHHADDQAETVMMRLASGSKLDGLAGMKAVAGIPECWDVFGAKKVAIGRPLLAVGKERLKATCEYNNVKWFEDRTNHDQTYTHRNAVRQLLSASPPRLPRALQRNSLISISQRAQKRNRIVKETALHLLHSHCKYSINIRTGTLHLSLPQGHTTLWGDVSEPVLMCLLTGVAEIVSPNQRVETRRMLTVIERVFYAKDGDQIPLFTCAGLTWMYCGNQKWTLNREPFQAQKKGDMTELKITENSWSEWKLWDGRWWIRVQTHVGVKRCYVRVLGVADMKLVRMMAVKRGLKGQLEEALKEMKMGIRFTVPAVFWRYQEGGEVLVSLPTLGLDFLDHVRCQVKFKS